VVFVLANFLVYRRHRLEILTLQRLPPEENPVEKSTREHLQKVVSDLNDDQVRFLRALLKRAGRASGVELREGEQLGGENLYRIAVSLHQKGLVTIEKMSPEEAGYITGFQKRQWYQVKPEYTDALGQILLSER
jgi:predicted transcriptional regulator